MKRREFITLLGGGRSARAHSSRRGHPNSQFEPLRCRLRRRGTGGNEAT